MCIVYTILTGILLLIFQDPIMHLFTGDETVIAYGKICMLYFCPFYWMLGILQGALPVRCAAPARACRPWWCC